MELKELVTTYKDVVRQRKVLEEAVKNLKEGREAELRDQILQYMLEQGVQSVHFPEVGHVVRVVKSHYEIQDKDKFAMAMLQSLVVAGEEGRPLTDGFIAQFRPGKDTFEEFIKSGHSMDQCGVALVEKPELSLRQA